jgi:hypothetical protein
MIILTIAQNIIYYGSSRLRAPIEPMLILLAAGFIWWLTYKEKGTLRWMIDEIRHNAQTSSTTPRQSENALALDETSTGNEQIMAGDR